MLFYEMLFGRLVDRSWLTNNTINAIATGSRKQINDIISTREYFSVC